MLQGEMLMEHMTGGDIALYFGSVAGGDINDRYCRGRCCVMRCNVTGQDINGRDGRERNYGGRCFAMRW